MGAAKKEKRQKGRARMVGQVYPSLAEVRQVPEIRAIAQEAVDLDFFP
jgi:hypothetical protein